jgi:hypothetical protein
VAVLRGQLGAFQANTLETNINSLNVALENVTSSESDITDANFASETSNLTRAQILDAGRHHGARHGQRDAAGYGSFVSSFIHP